VFFRVLPWQVIKQCQSHQVPVGDGKQKYYSQEY
jgi:hypothetical protein